MLDFEIVIPYLQESLLGFFPIFKENEEISTLVLTKKRSYTLSLHSERFFLYLCKFYWIDKDSQSAYLHDRGMREEYLPLLTPVDIYYPVSIGEDGIGYFSYLYAIPGDKNIVNQIKNLPPLLLENWVKGWKLGNTTYHLSTIPAGRLRRPYQNF
ncbi:MAG: hypothetical protein Q4Q07_00740 [Tissierellia bacterium]|nr:hypothetical protein [Tissierellia bacterium]